MTNKSLSKPDHNLAMLFYSNCSTPLIGIPTSVTNTLLDDILLFFKHNAGLCRVHVL